MMAWNAVCSAVPRVPVADAELVGTRRVFAASDDTRCLSLRRQRQTTPFTMATAGAQAVWTGRWKVHYWERQVVTSQRLLSICQILLLLPDTSFRKVFERGLLVCAPSFRWYQIILLDKRGYVGMNNLPRVVLQPRDDRESNAQPLDSMSNALPLCCHAAQIILVLKIFIWTSPYPHYHSHCKCFWLWIWLTFIICMWPGFQKVLP